VKKLVATAVLLAAVVLPATTAHADDARFGTKACPAGHIGRIVWWYDLDNQYEEIARFCIYTGP
jgi:hypothetical protein